MSDYCLDNPHKNDCICFTISPVMGQPIEMARYLAHNLPRDIKDMHGEVSEQEISFIRNNKAFFSIVILLQDKNKMLKTEWLKEDVKKIIDSPFMYEKGIKKLKCFDKYLQKKSLPKKVLDNLMLVTGWFSRIVGYLSVRHYTEQINWFPDRDDIMNIGNRIIHDLANINCNNAIAGRVKMPVIHVGVENPITKEFVFDDLIRYPDIITGVFSSIDLEHQLADKPKHAQLLSGAIIDNPRIVVFTMKEDEISCGRCRSKIIR